MGCALLITGLEDKAAQLEPGGPDQAIVPPVAPEFSCIGEPTQTGLFEVGFTVGIGLTTTVVVPVHVAAPVAVTVYSPAFAAVELGIVTDCPVAENPLGPDHV